MLKTRIFTALMLLSVFIPAVCLLPSYLWASLMLALTLLCLHEWSGLICLSSQARQIFLGLCSLSAILALFFLLHFGMHALIYFAFPCFVIGSLFWLIIVPAALYFGCFPSSKLLNAVLGWFLLLSLWMALVIAQASNPRMLLVIISTIWLADSAAYFAGKNFGKHKLAPTISPGKTWEGVLGALIATAIYGVVLLGSGAVLTGWIVPGLWLITVVGIYGDLFESLLKRRAKIKDSGQLLPGHGGLLDRIDGVIPAMPLGVLALFYFHFIFAEYAF